MNQNSCAKQLLLIFIVMFWSLNIFAQEDELIRIERFFGGSLQKTNDFYTLSAEATFIGSGQMQEVYFNWKMIDSEDIHSTFFGSININAQIPYRFEAEEKWIPQQEGFYQIQYWFSGLNEYEQDIVNSPIQEINLEVRDNFVERDLVLLESFSSVNCGSCVIATAHLHELLLQNPNTLKQIYYHPFTYEGSPLNEFNPKDQELRKNFYNVSSTPNSAIGGMYFGSSFDVDTFLLEKEKASWAGMQFEGSWEKQNEDLHIQLEAELFIGVENTHRDLFLFISAIQDSLHFDEPPGTNGEKEFYNLMRFFYPDAQGIPITDENLQQGHISLDITTPWRPELEPERMEFIAFIQDINTKEILQASLIPFVGDDDSDDDDTSLANPLQERIFTIAPNPAKDHLYINNHNRQQINSVLLYDLHGKLLKEVLFGYDTDIHLLVNDLPSGIYIMEISFNENNILLHKVIIL